MKLIHNNYHHLINRICATVEIHSSHITSTSLALVCVRMHTQIALKLSPNVIVVCVIMQS